MSGDELTRSQLINWTDLGRLVGRKLTQVEAARMFDGMKLEKLSQVRREGEKIVVEVTVKIVLI